MTETPDRTDGNGLRPLSMLELVGIFFRIGSLAFGGGGATLAMMHSEFCVRRPAVSEEEFQVLFGISRVVPGMNLLSLTALLGYRSHGLAGAVAALTALTVPSFLLIILGCRLLAGGHPQPIVQGIVRGLSPAAAALLVVTGWQLCTGSLKKQGRLARALWMTAVAVGVWAVLAGRIHPAWVVLGGAAAGVLLSRWIGGTAP